MRIVQGLPATGLIMPTDDEATRLMKIVAAAHPSLAGVDLFEFRRAFWAQGQCFRTPAPVSKRYFHAHVDDACELLERHGAKQIGGTAFLAACIGAGDVPWQAADPSVGALLELGLNPHNGRPCSNVWLQILTGEASLLKPTTPRWAAPLLEADRAPRPRFFREGKEVTDAEIGWGR